SGRLDSALDVIEEAIAENKDQPAPLDRWHRDNSAPRLHFAHPAHYRFSRDFLALKRGIHANSHSHRNAAARASSLIVGGNYGRIGLHGLLLDMDRRGL